MSEFYTKQTIDVLKTIRKMNLEGKDISFDSLSEVSSRKGYELFAILASLYYNEYISVEDPNFYKFPINRTDFTIYMAPRGYDILFRNAIL